MYTTVCLVVFIILASLVCYWHHVSKTTHEDLTFPMFICSAFALAVAVGFLICVSDCVLWLYNPKAWGLDYILSKLSGC